MSLQGIIIQKTNHFQSIGQVFEKLLDNSSLVDCTIAAEGQYLKAHKVMLSACSPYFEVLFSQENMNPIVILKDTKFEDLKAVIDFIYRGKVQIPESQLQSFANTIESLHIRGMGNAEQFTCDVVTAPKGLPVMLLPVSSPLVVRSEFVVQQEDGNQLAAVVSEKSDIRPAQPPPLVEETPVCIQSIEALPYNQFAEECEAESSIKIVRSWSESLNKVEEKVDMKSTPSSLSDEETNVQLPATELSDLEKEGNVDVEETPILENSKNDADQFTTETNAEECVDESAGIAPEAADTAPSDLVSTTRETEATTEQSIAPKAVDTAASDLVLTTRETEATTEQIAKARKNGVRGCDVLITRLSNPWPQGRDANGRPCYPVRLSNQDAATTSYKEGSVKNAPLPLPSKGKNVKKPSYTCANCDRVFTYQKSLARHQMIHSGVKPFACTQCPKSFSRKTHLERHQYTHTEQRPFSCTMCPKSYTSKHYLIVHERIHTGQRPFSCTKCPKSFFVKHSLMEHLRIHTNLRPFSCTVCERAFTNKSNLIAHERIHTGQRFACAICDKSFSVKHTLKVHLRTHTGQRPFSCDICGKSFRVRQSVIEHLRTHTKQRPFSCPLCEKSFTSKSNLTQHQRTHTGQSQYSCAHCKRKYTRKSTLIKHLQIHKGK